MGIFGKLFGGGKKVSKETLETRGEHMPDLKIPVDEKFTIYFYLWVIESWSLFTLSLIRLSFPCYSILLFKLGVQVQICPRIFAA